MPIAEDPAQRPPGEEPDPFADLVLDEDFVKGASVKEQSGRSRMLAAKWKREPPQEEQAWRPPTEIRRRRFGRRAKAADPWGNPQRRAKPNWQAPVFVLLTIAVVAAALNVNGLHSWYLDHVGSTPDRGIGALPVSPKPVITQAPETAKPTAAPSTDAPLTPTVAQPWLGSPAESWPAGADAIVLPDAKAMGVFDKDQVAAQLKTAKNFLVAANLDPAVLAGGNPQAALDLLNPSSRKVAEQELAHPDTQHNPINLFSRFNPRTAIPAGDVVKLQGRMWLDDDGEQGVVVHTDYTFVYAVVPGPEQFKPLPPSSPGPSPSDTTGAKSVAWVQLDPHAEVTREIVRRVADFRFADPDKYEVQDGKLSLLHWQGTRDNNYCDSDDGWLEPYFKPLPGSDSSAGEGSGTPVDPYDRSKPIPNDDTDKCGTLSRS
ncbi:SCO2583/SCO2584 N-terminal domain-containing protein [Kitasatospora kifunensis]|uniref:Uncharacterized protein n=1 Tax=Kitasatospora kifunensis TaxID=58351 RepID=A0A7W7VWZ4_KITKI|nr:hypothetical protein [Kitasatospora kifunensis]MBB4925065.1 hypothetical protein [Kitasatospora kifunensis]